MVKSVFKGAESPLKFLTTDGIPNAFFQDGMIMAEGSKFHKMKANEKNINEAVDDTDYGDLSQGDMGEQELYKLMIEVFKGNIVGPEAEQIMEAAQGEFPMEFIAKEQQKYMIQPKASGSVPDRQIMPEQLPIIRPGQDRQILPNGTPLPQADPRNNVHPQTNMKNIYNKDRERMVAMATMDKLGLLT